MRVRVVYFGLLKEIVGQGSHELEIPERSPASFLWERLRSTYPELQRYERAIAIAVNQVYSKPDRELHEGDEIGFLPPVSGGLEGTATSSATLPVVSEHARLQAEPIETQSLLSEIKRGEDGAVTLFDGIVRNNTRGRKTLYLEYESYVTMAIAEMEKLAVKALADFAVRDVRIVHRLGRMEIGDSSVVIVVASAHRAAAFDACRFIIDTLKKTVPIWKKEFFEDGAVWADGEPFPPDVKTV